ncbi:unnamed protein product [Moneuplotes crassus]|uniref:Uncharacterized protein n=1 Tax=Euplotes crassus TaxID=5936 RepID=A0AAD2D4Z3_EUPCR|nr:unnamed protein product [Moneuplotes crassus]
MVVAANVCQNDAQNAGSPLSGSLGMAGTNNVYFLDILEDQDSELLYFIGYFGSSPYDTIIYKSDPALAKVKVMTYYIYCNFHTLAMSSSNDFIYIQDQRTGKILEIRTSDLVISRELEVSSASVDLNTNMEVDKGFYFSFIISSIMHTCRWDMSSTNLDCFTFGANSPPSLAPISADLLFFGSIDTAADQYYLVSYNFSSSSQVWKKSIACPTSGCVSKYSASLLSTDESWIYTMVLYDGNFIFHKLSTADGSPQNSGLIWNDSGYLYSYSIKEFSDFIAINIFSTSLSIPTRLIMVTSSTTEILKEYKAIDSSDYAVGRLLYQGEELMYHSGRIETNYAFFFSRTPTNNIEQISELQEDTPLFSSITTNYQASATASNPSITTSTKTLNIVTSPAITTTDITSSTNPSFAKYVALWNSDLVQSVQSNSSVQLSFTWACAQSSNNTAITFSLNQTGTNVIPDWVNLDASSLQLNLTTTPRLTVATVYYFSLKIAFNSEVHYKNFQITVEECTIGHCDLCQLGSPSICQTCTDGYQSSNGGTSCSIMASSTEATTPTETTTQTEETAITGATETTTALIGCSVVAASASSMLSLSSINSVFSLMNGMQLILLLPMVPDFLSPVVEAYLNGVSFAMFSFDFINIKDLWFISDISSSLSYPQTDNYLNDLGLRSKSSIANNLSLLLIVVLFGFVHLGIYIMVKCTKNSKHRKCKSFIDKLFKFFTFNIYIRLFIQAFLFLCLSIFSEFSALNFNSTVAEISFGLCAVLTICSIVLLLLCFHMYYISCSQVGRDKYWQCSEYFNGVKANKYSKLYSSVYLTTRVLLVLFLILGKSFSAIYKAAFFCFLNFSYGVYLLTSRPFENPQDSIIECINQTLFSFLTVPLLWLNTEESWTSSYETFYTTLFVSASIISSIVCFIFLIKLIITFWRKRKAAQPLQKTSPKEAASPPRAPQDEELETPSPLATSKSPFTKPQMHKLPIPPSKAIQVLPSKNLTLEELKS